MSLSSLPLDVHLIVLSSLSSDKITLSNAALTCKAWTPCAHSFLFHSIVLDTQKNTVLKLSLLCEKNPVLFHYFRVLALTAIPSLLEQNLLSSLFLKMANLNELRLTPFLSDRWSFEVDEKPLQNVLLSNSPSAFRLVHSLSLDGLQGIPVKFLAGFPSLTTLELHWFGSRPVSFDHRVSFPLRNLALVTLRIGNNHLDQAAWLFPLVSATLCSLSLEISSIDYADKISLEQLSGLQHLHHLDSFLLYGSQPRPESLLDTTTRALQFLSPNAPLRTLKLTAQYFDPLISTPEMWAGIAKEVVKRNTQIRLQFSTYESELTVFSSNWDALVTKWFREESLREVSEKGLLGQVDVICMEEDCMVDTDSPFA